MKTRSPDGLLHYLPNYQVVICKDCKFAVQPSALQSHLLRHHIYRNDRQQIVTWLSKLDLAEPENVRLPDNEGPPLADLPVHQGFRCDHGSCQHYCASLKRMSKHWSDEHGESKSKNIKVSPVSLQTFFRGNKLRYFEVRPSDDADEYPDNVRRGTAVRSSDHDMSPMAQAPAESSMTARQPSPHSSMPPSLDMESLYYLHYFTLSTAPTVRRGPQEPVEFWAKTLVHDAFRHPFLMYGMLGLSAAHLATIHYGEDVGEVHRQHSLRYQTGGLADFRNAMRSPTADNSPALVAYSRIIGIQRLTWTHEDGTPISPSTPEGMDYLLEFFHMIRGSIDTWVKLQSYLPKESSFTLLKEELNAFRDMEDEEMIDVEIDVKNHVPELILHSIGRLKDRLLALLPTHQASDVHAIEPDLILLRVTTARSFAVDDAFGIFGGLQFFCYAVSDTFIQFLEARHPMTLIVFAHWLLLFPRIEEVWWFVKGQPKRLLDIITNNLDAKYAHAISHISFDNPATPASV